MRVLVLEDESGAARNLLDLLEEVDPGLEIVAVLESVREAIFWLKKNQSPDLGFFDIRLADGESFEVFDKTIINFPVIFTTAYDEYALKAFKVNSIDYLMKPVDKDDLGAALEKYRTLYRKDSSYDPGKLQNTLLELHLQEEKQYKKSFLVYVKDQIIPVAVEQIAYFCLDHKRVYCVTVKDKKYLIDQALDKIGSQLDPENFFRANRQYLVSRQSVKSAHQHFNRKLRLQLSPAPEKDVLIAKPKAAQFKAWLER